MTTNPFRIRSEADVLALIPFTLGFHPENSLVLVTLSSAGHPFTARVDLPASFADLGAVSEPLVRAAVRNGAERALVVAYTGDAVLADAAVSALTQALRRCSVRTLLQLRADGTRWHPLGGETPDQLTGEGTAYDLSTHELTSQAVLDGRVTMPSRSELADTLDPVDPDLIDEVRAASRALDHLGDDVGVLRAESAWLTAQVAAHVERGVRPGPVAVARVLRAVDRPKIRDLTWARLTRAEAPPRVEFWREVVRSSPPELAASAAAVLAILSWMAGEGALAWCAVDRSLAADRHHSLGRLVSDMLTDALPPSTWRPFDEHMLGLHA